MSHPDQPSAAAIDALLAGHALGDLDDGERQQLAALLRQRPELRARLDQFSTTLDLLPLALPATAAPPARLRRRLLEPPRPERPPRPWLLPALLGVGLLVLGLDLHQTRQQLAQLQQQLQAPRRSAPGKSAPENQGRRLILASTLGDSAPSAKPSSDPSDSVSRGSPTGEVVVMANSNNNLLILNNLPAPPPHHVYRLWATVDGQKVGCVAFVPTAQGHVAMPIPPMPSNLASTISVTLEANATGTVPRGPMVLSTRV
jgi:hypothetical protein